MTKRQLRRLALQTSRYPSWRPVLQDALLEMYPEEFERKIEAAEKEACQLRTTVAVLFVPGWMKKQYRGSPFSLLTYRQPGESEQDFVDRQRRVQRGFQQATVIAYVTDPSRSR